VASPEQALTTAAAAAASATASSSGRRQTSEQTRVSTSGSATTTPRLLTRIMSSLGVSSPGSSPRTGKLGNLVAEDESSKAAAAGANVAAAGANGVVEVSGCSSAGCRLCAAVFAALACRVKVCTS
jgi:hypothetical protein